MRLLADELEGALSAVGLNDIPEAFRANLTLAFEHAVMAAVGQQITGQMSTAQLAELKAFQDASDDDGMQEWLIRTVENGEEIVDDCVNTALEDIKSQAGGWRWLI